MTGYLDLPSGLSGDMFLGCFVDAGWPIEALRETIGRLDLPVDEWSIDAQSVMKGPLRATLVEVRAAEGRQHRHLRHVREIIEAGDLIDAIKERAIAVFTRLAEAEATVHGTTVEEIHFHEVGAVDAIIDIVGAVAGLEALGIDELHASSVPLGSGWAETAHGRIPLPAPATLELLAACHAPTRPAPGDGEWVTPTGAALLAELATFSQPAMSVTRTGIGAGRRDADWPNVARLWLGEPSAHAGELVQLETNIDDMNPQLVPSVIDALLAAGALDAWATPVHMKKGRPGVVLGVLAPATREAVLVDVLLRHTTTLGVRVLPVARRPEADRDVRRVETPFGEVAVKLKRIEGEALGAAPEYEDCARLARASGVAVKEVLDAANAAARALLSGH